MPSRAYAATMAATLISNVNSNALVHVKTNAMRYVATISSVNSNVIANVICRVMRYAAKDKMCNTKIRCSTQYEAM